MLDGRREKVDFFDENLASDEEESYYLGEKTSSKRQKLNNYIEGQDIHK